MVNSVDGHDTVENREAAGDAGQTRGKRYPAGWYLDPSDDALQRYWTGDSWTTDVRLRPIALAQRLPPPSADEVWPPEVEAPKSLLPAVIEKPDVTEISKNSMGSGGWYSEKLLLIPIVLVTALAVVGLLTRTTDGPGTTDAPPVATTIQVPTTTVASTITQPTTTTPATSTAPTTATTSAPTTTAPTTTAPATTTTQTSPTSQAVATIISPEEQFERWEAGMAAAFPADRLPADDRSLTESNAAFLCARATGNESYDSVRGFVRQFFYDAEPEYWSQQPAEELDSYSTAYVNTSLDVYCPDLYVQLLER